jgi:peroxin-19
MELGRLEDFSERSKMATAGEDLDDILDQALDDLEQIDTAEQHENDAAASPSAPSAGLVVGPQELIGSLIDNEDGLEEDKGGDVLDEFMKQVQSTVTPAETKKSNARSNATTGTSTTKGSRNRPGSLNKPKDADDVEAALATILQQMTTMDPDEFDGDFGAGDLNPDSFVEGMMEQLLSKELMYEPMKHVADQFPDWLEGKKDSLPEDELAK